MKTPQQVFLRRNLNPLKNGLPISKRILPNKSTESTKPMEETNRPWKQQEPSLMPKSNSNWKQLREELPRDSPSTIVTDSFLPAPRISIALDEHLQNYRLEPKSYIFYLKNIILNEFWRFRKRITGKYPSRILLYKAYWWGSLWKGVPYEKKIIGLAICCKKGSLFTK